MMTSSQVGGLLGCFQRRDTASCACQLAMFTCTSSRTAAQPGLSACGSSSSSGGRGKGEVYVLGVPEMHDKLPACSSRAS